VDGETEGSCGVQWFVAGEGNMYTVWSPCLKDVGSAAICEFRLGIDVDRRPSSSLVH
jgi:hypothetical protein